MSNPRWRARRGVPAAALAALAATSAWGFTLTPEPAPPPVDQPPAPVAPGDGLAPLACEEPQPAPVDDTAAFLRELERRPPAPLPPEPSELVGEGLASYYHDSLAGRRTASGERYRPQGLTAAHPSLPFGTKVRVIDPASGRSVVVTINDRGPFVRGRVIDLSRSAAERIGLLRAGLKRVRVEKI